jgi:excisionase family DNA binding protein
MKELLTIEQATATLPLSPKPIKGWLRPGKLTGCKIGRQWRVREADLEAFIQASLMMHVCEPTASAREAQACT